MCVGEVRKLVIPSDLGMVCSTLLKQTCGPPRFHFFITQDCATISRPPPVTDHLNRLMLTFLFIVSQRMARVAHHQKYQVLMMLSRCSIAIQIFCFTISSVIMLTHPHPLNVCIRDIMDHLALGHYWQHKIHPSHSSPTLPRKCLACLRSRASTYWNPQQGYRRVVIEYLYCAS